MPSPERPNSTGRAKPDEPTTVPKERSPIRTPRTRSALPTSRTHVPGDSEGAPRNAAGGQPPARPRARGRVCRPEKTRRPLGHPVGDRRPHDSPTRGSQRAESPNRAPERAADWLRDAESDMRKRTPKRLRSAETLPEQYPKRLSGSRTTGRGSVIPAPASTGGVTKTRPVRPGIDHSDGGTTDAVASLIGLSSPLKPDSPFTDADAGEFER